MRIGHYRFRFEPGAETNGRWWYCGDAGLGIYAFTPWGAWLRLMAWYRREPRAHWPGCDGRHHRAELCPQANECRACIAYEPGKPCCESQGFGAGFVTSRLPETGRKP